MYPPLEPYHSFHLTVDHLGQDTPIKIYVQLSGNKHGIPIIYLHGGPGDHSTAFVRRLFHPRHWHIVQFDQRGCGKSTPPNHLRKNTTQLLIKDIEAIRKHLNVPKVALSGGSWGTTLALAYAIKHPALGLILRGVYDLSTEPDAVLSYMYPDLEDNLKHFTRKRSASKLLHSSSRTKYLKLLNDPTPMYLNSIPRPDSIQTQTNLTLIGNHYQTHSFFITKKWLYRNLHRITCPVYIVQGRYDLVTPPIMAYNIHKHLPHSHITFVKAGHTHHDLHEQLIHASNQLFLFISQAS